MNHQLFITKRHLNTTAPNPEEVGDKLELQVNCNAVDTDLMKKEETNELLIYLKTRIWGSIGNFISFDYEGISLTDCTEKYSVDEAQEKLTEIVDKEIYPYIYESLREIIEDDIELAGHVYAKLPSVHTLKDGKSQIN